MAGGVVKRYIVVHHSATIDGRLNDWAGICKYHTSWRRLDRGEIVTAQEAGELTAQGVRCEPPWRGPCGYHYGIERDNGLILVRQGRPVAETGAHATGFNESGVGLCIVGNYDREAPDPLLYDEIKKQIRAIAAEIGMDAAVMAREKYILGHRETYALRGVTQQKTCPGSAFDMDKLRQELSDNI
jgi:hypothetical protein